MLNLKLFLLLENDLSKSLLLNGLYSVDKNVIVTHFRVVDGVKKELIYAIGNKMLSVFTKTPFQTLQEIALQNNLKRSDIPFDFSVSSLQQKFNVYRLKKTVVRRSSQMNSELDLQLVSSKNLNLKAEINVYGHGLDKSQLIDDSSSATFSSTLSSLTTGSFGGMVGRRGRRGEVKRGRFGIVGKVIWCVIIVVVGLSVGEFWVLTDYSSIISSNDSTYSTFREFTRLYFESISTLFSIMCVSDLPKINSTCTRILNKYDSQGFTICTNQGRLYICWMVHCVI